MKHILFKRQQLIFWLYQLYLNPDLKQTLVTDEVSLETKKILLEKINTIETKLKKKISPQWSWERMNNLYKAVLVQAVFEFEQFHIDKPVVIDQAIEFIKKFDADQQYQFVNGILDQVL